MMTTGLESALSNPSGRTLLMGIINATPDSFSDGGRYLASNEAVARGMALAAEGADILDIGGESTRPGAEPVDGRTEWDRTGPVIRGLREAGGPPVSIDTTKAEVAEKALAAGAVMVNDVSGLTADPEMAGLVAGAGCYVTIMHRRGDSREMYAEANYKDVAGEVRGELLDRVELARRAGIRDGRIILDPGIGFAKLAGHNFELIRNIGEITGLPFPIMAGPSRKKFIGEATGKGVDEREAGTAAACAILVLGGVRILRVHDAAAVKDAVLLAEAVKRGRPRT